MNISKMDTNLASTGLTDEKINWINSQDKRISVHGVYYDEKEKLYVRVPGSVTEATGNPSVVTLARATAGGRIRFVTDSDYITIKASVPYFYMLSHMSITASHGFSVYVNGKYENRFAPTFKSFLKACNNGNENILFTERKKIADSRENRLIEIYFPLYGGVSELHIGIEEGSTISEAPLYKNPKPLLFYGSSITQGACVSRPGNDYISIIARRLDADYINLGFSGNGNAEDAMIEYIASLDASLYAFDYNMYADKKDRVLPSHFSIYERIREKHPDALILLYDKPGCDYGAYPEREEIIRATYEKAIAMGDKRVCYIPAKDLLGEGERDCCLVDHNHPNDLGAMRMADAIYSVIKNLI